ncbi:hypothetical protein PsorP6_017458 [Peronosclerospora sorghi]|uniref:Uncharacterized protein n=1 Tax=Peronosclerospora sorghi TaxID=230839 RepID=A0ACC0WP21_9STRA|nr:hypothetical protein PsorP6_017458 [Peronosclerospora sorghi]
MGSLLTPPSSPPRRITPPPADTAFVVRRKNKRTQNSDDFANLTSKERLKDSTGITTSNYLSVLFQIEAELDLVEAPLGVEVKPRFQIKPTIALFPDAVKKSTEASHFLTKHHTKVVKTTQPITVAETAESMIGDSADVQLDLLPDRLVMAATRIPSAHKALKSATNPDRVIQVAHQSPLSMNNARNKCGTTTAISKISRRSCFSTAFSQRLSPLMHGVLSMSVREYSRDQSHAETDWINCFCLSVFLRMFTEAPHTTPQRMPKII